MHNEIQQHEYEHLSTTDVKYHFQLNRSCEADKKNVHHCHQFEWRWKKILVDSSVIWIGCDCFLNNTIKCLIRGMIIIIIIEVLNKSALYRTFWQFPKLIQIFWINLCVCISLVSGDHCFLTKILGLVILKRHVLYTSHNRHDICQPCYQWYVIGNGENSIFSKKK